ncbi:DUF2795 domain-containing protein [Actinacidiphila sp. DG2A-62]|jgi:hypothetical protein|uniref:DUF2795 domain-containing protein n=1 Tax=Actinacidiphila sp. DG2A-62 TaxID=3108821 RepID=UPI002DB76098|nr:DUF2795 domain-containing protein [Actinacidiphila sp. DG2A-62]MEC3998820.1 DUF2795 domain-containing protein [Actinacidiphila sp. DG2A-62]
MADQGSNKTGSVRDDELKREIQGELKAGRAVRVEEDFEPQPSGEDQPVAEFSAAVPEGSAPPGMTPQDVALRSALARHLERGLFPARRSALLGALHRHQAPDDLLERVAALPDHESYENVQAVVRALGLGVEARRV